MNELEVYGLIGEDGFRRLVRAFYGQVPGDDLLGPMYPRDDLAGAEERLREFLIGRFGGPPTYVEKRGHPRLRERHAPFRPRSGRARSLADAHGPRAHRSAAARRRGHGAAAVLPRGRDLPPQRITVDRMRLRHWDPAFDGLLTEDGLRHKLEAMGYVVRRAAYPPHHAIAEHQDAADTIEAVVSGRLRVIVAGHFAVLGPGDHVTVARGTHHSAAAVGDEPVVSLVGTRAHAIVSGRDNGV